MGDSLDDINVEIGAMKLDDNYEAKFMQLKIIYEDYKKEIEDLRKTNMKKNKEIEQLKKINEDNKKAIENKDKELEKLKIMNEDNRKNEVKFEMMKIQVKAQVKKVKKIVPDSISENAKNIKSEIVLIKDLAKFGPVDAETKWRISETDYISNKTIWGEEFDGKMLPYRYRLAFHQPENECLVYFCIEAGNHDENLQWPFKGMVRVTVSQDNNPILNATEYKVCKIQGDPRNSNVLKFNLRDFKKSQGVLVKCWIFPWYMR